MNKYLKPKPKLLVPQDFCVTRSHSASELPDTPSFRGDDEISLTSLRSPLDYTGVVGSCSSSSALASVDRGKATESAYSDGNEGEYEAQDSSVFELSYHGEMLTLNINSVHDTNKMQNLMTESEKKIQNLSPVLLDNSIATFKATDCDINLCHYPMYVPSPGIKEDTAGITPLRTPDSFLLSAVANSIQPSPLCELYNKYSVNVQQKSSNYIKDIYSDDYKLPVQTSSLHNADPADIAYKVLYSERPLHLYDSEDRRNIGLTKLSLSDVKQHHYGEREKTENNNVCMSEGKASHSRREKENFLEEYYHTPHVRRKLVFDNVTDSNSGMTKHPEFKCSLKMAENIFDDGNLNRENQQLLSIPPPLHQEKKELPPVGVFWDIENCRVPKRLSATHIVQAIRNRFFVGHREAEFLCVCDTQKENTKILEELNDAQVNVMHVGSLVKNAADDKLLQGMRRFADLYGAGATIILISGDSDFATELYDLRYRKSLHVILIHNAHAQDSLKLSAHETILFSDVTLELVPKHFKPKFGNLCRDITVWNLPVFEDIQSVRRHLQYLTKNYGGKGIYVKYGAARISFSTPEQAAGAKKRIDGEDIFGSKVFCTYGKPVFNRAEFISRSSRQPGFPPVDQECYDEKLNPPTERDRHNSSHYETNCSYSSVTDQQDWITDHPKMDANGALWNKSLSSSSGGSNMNGHCYLNNTWSGMQSPTSHMVNEGSGMGSYNSSPILHSSSQGSSRDSSPHAISLPKNQDFNRGSYHHVPSFTNLPMKTGVNLHSTEFRSVDTRSPRISQPCSGSYSKNGWPSSLSSTDGHNQSLYSFGNISLGDSTQGICTPQMPVELQITNLDQHIDAREMKKILLAWFRERVMVLHVSVFVQSDGSLAATVTVPTIQDAQYAISQLHRKRIGTKRIIISYVNHSHHPPEIKRSKVMNLLKEVPGRKLPLFKFRELYERRYQEAIGVSEMYCMRDIITVSDNSTGRMVCLHSEYRNFPATSITDSSLHDPDELRYCKLHCKGPDKSVGWAERDHSSILPCAFIPLKTLGNAISILLKSHNDRIPLASLVDCYRAEVDTVEENPDGVPLEHLVSCLPGVRIVVGLGGFKHIQRAEVKLQEESDDVTRNISPPLIGHLALLSRELVDLLKTFPQCRMAFSKFIPAYHHHFGRQCRVADYGYTKLVDLLASLPHLIQIMGEGAKRIITLAHKAQVKRFSSDLLRVLKNQPSKVISLDAFPDAYEKVMNRPWLVTEYGVCDFMDLLKEVQETTVILSKDEQGMMVAIPKREQTAEEIERTRLFSTEVIELLRHSPQCKMQFNRFIPAYHHHFGRQCRVADYGFSKLIELFEAIPDILQIVGEDDDGEKTLQLVEKEFLKILGDQIYMLVKNSPKRCINMSTLSAVFLQYYGYSLRPEQYNCESIKELLEKLRNYVKLDDMDDPGITLVDRSFINALWTKTQKVLWDVPNCCLPVTEFKEQFLVKYNEMPKIDVLKKDLEEYVQVIGDKESGEIKLVPLQVFARDLVILLRDAGGRMLLVNFEPAYLNRFGIACRPATLGFPNVVALVQSLGSVATIKGRGAKRILVLNKGMGEILNYCPPAPRNVVKSTKESAWSTNAVPVNPVPPPPIYSKPKPSAHPPTPPCDHRLCHQEVNPHIVMGLTPPGPQPTFHQPASPVIYPGSPVTPNGSMVWGQVWSPQYSIIPPMSPAPHYMMPTVPINWGSIASSPGISSPSKPVTGSLSMRRNAAPISIQTLDQLGKVSPPNPSELPTPELFTTNSVSTDSSLLLHYNGSGIGAVTEPSELIEATKAVTKRMAAQFNGSSTDA